MSVKDLKASFAASSAPYGADLENDAPVAQDGPGDDGLYPRSLHILDFALTNLFETAYLIPHIDKHRITDGLDMMPPADLKIYEDVAQEVLQGKKIDRLPALHDPVYDYSFMFDGLDDWTDFSVTLTLTDPDNEDIETRDAHPAMQAALAEFMDDFSVATSAVEGIRVDTSNGIIRARDPLALFKIIAEVISTHNEAADAAEEELKMREDDPRFPLECRSIPLPQYGYDMHMKGDDADLERQQKASDGYDYMYGEHTQETALQNLPPRVYKDTTDVYLAAADTELRINYSAPMIRLDEMEAIIRNELRKEKSYAPNPLLNLH